MNKISVDFGSGVTKIYMPGCGVVLKEATCIAVEEYDSDDGKKLRIKAYGDKARSLSGRAAARTKIVNPVFEGNIVHEELAAELLSYFLEKIEISGRRAKRTEAIFILPCGITQSVRKKYKRLAEACGIGYVYFTLAPFAAVLGHNVVINESTPMFSLDIGYSVTDIAAFSQDGIISGMSINIGGNSIDMQLCEEAAQKFNLKIGSLTAERLKNKAGSLWRDDNKMLVIDGSEITSNSPSSVCVNSEQIYGVLTTYIDKVAEYVKLVISRLPAEVSSAVMHGGIYLTGGLSGLDGIADYLEEKLGIRINQTEEGQLAAVIGGGAILSEDYLLDCFATVDEE